MKASFVISLMLFASGFMKPAQCQSAYQALQGRRDWGALKQEKQMELEYQRQLNAMLESDANNLKNKNAECAQIMMSEYAKKTNYTTFGNGWINAIFTDGKYICRDGMVLIKDGSIIQISGIDGVALVMPTSIANEKASVFLSLKAGNTNINTVATAYIYK